MWKPICVAIEKIPNNATLQASDFICSETHLHGFGRRLLRPAVLLVAVLRVLQFVLHDVPDSIQTGRSLRQADAAALLRRRLPLDDPAAVPVHRLRDSGRCSADLQLDLHQHLWVDLPGQHRVHHLLRSKRLSPS